MAIIKWCVFGLFVVANLVLYSALSLSNPILGLVSGMTFGLAMLTLFVGINTTKDAKIIEGLENRIKEYDTLTPRYIFTFRDSEGGNFLNHEHYVAEDWEEARRTYANLVNNKNVSQIYLHFLGKKIALEELV
jgi:hypothetical protein